MAGCSTYQGRRDCLGIVFPLFSGASATNSVYRGCRLPYAWIPQLQRPSERPVKALAPSEFRVP